MGLRERVQLYKRVEEHRKRPLITYITSPRVGAEGQIGGDMLPELLDQLTQIPQNEKSVDLLVVS